ncbi:hypothetical protein DUI87_10972 [Hirundo rustica rustica]|uniref:Laminin G domain-containing protein n=1 Tax=Hirundo rustica rustica TaxID=333673 RepID=A0A3M0KQ25_HIRRU|nr:hypothetical protein DUI87_10972 [Hirundo rustica rustica]
MMKLMAELCLLKMLGNGTITAGAARASALLFPSSTNPGKSQTSSGLYHTEDIRSYKNVFRIDQAQGTPAIHTEDFSYARYYGDSYLEFQGLHLNMQNFIHLEFRTYNPHGLLLNIDQSLETIQHFLIRLVIKNGTLEYQYLCDEAAEVKSITTTARVDDGHWYNVQIRPERKI